MPVRKRTIHTDDAVALFRRHGMHDKERLFEYRRVSKVNIYSMNEFEDYYYGYMVPSAGYLRYFALYLYDEGFVIQMPSRKEPRSLAPFTPKSKLFPGHEGVHQMGGYAGHRDGGGPQRPHHKGRRHAGYGTGAGGPPGEEDRPDRGGDRRQEGGQIRPHCRALLLREDHLFHRLSIQLRAAGMVPHPISVDNYFVEREDNPRDENGEFDFECLEAVDTDLFNDQMSRLLGGEEVVLPTFNFKTGHKEFGGKPKKLGPEDVLVIEGIHCLNPKLTLSLPDENKFRIYISALTQLNIDEHNRIPTTDGRLIRRLVRDARTEAPRPGGPSPCGPL